MECVIPTENVHFLTILNRIQSDLTQSAKDVYQYFSGFVQNGRDTIQPSYKAMAKNRKLKKYSNKTLRRCVALLAKLGIIKITSQQHKNGRDRSNLYTFLPQPLPASDHPIDHPLRTKLKNKQTTHDDTVARDRRRGSTHAKNASNGPASQKLIQIALGKLLAHADKHGIDLFYVNQAINTLKKKLKSGFKIKNVVAYALGIMKNWLNNPFKKQFAFAVESGALENDLPPSTPQRLNNPDEEIPF